MAELEEETNSLSSTKLCISVEGGGGLGSSPWDRQVTAPWKSVLLSGNGAGGCFSLVPMLCSIEVPLGTAG